MKSSFTVLVLACVLALGAFGGYYLAKHSGDTVATSPEPSPTPDDMIVIDAPLPESVVSSPLKVTGRARGTWFFEASFPVILTNWDGLIIAQAVAQAKSDWMTTDWVPFEATLTFDADISVSSRGALILKKDNPSGEPRYDDAREITIFFK